MSSSSEVSLAVLLRFQLRMVNRCVKARAVVVVADLVLALLWLSLGLYVLGDFVNVRLLSLGQDWAESGRRAAFAVVQFLSTAASGWWVWRLMPPGGGSEVFFVACGVSAVRVRQVSRVLLGSVTSVNAAASLLLGWWWQLPPGLALSWVVVTHAVVYGGFALALTCSVARRRGISQADGAEGTGSLRVGALPATGSGRLREEILSGIGLVAAWWFLRWEVAALGALITEFGWVAVRLGRWRALVPLVRRCGGQYRWVYWRTFAESFPSFLRIGILGLLASPSTHGWSWLILCVALAWTMPQFWFFFSDDQVFVWCVATFLVALIWASLIAMSPLGWLLGPLIAVTGYSEQKKGFER